MTSIPRAYVVSGAMYLSKLNSGEMADIWGGIPVKLREAAHEKVGDEHIIRGEHPILGAILIVPETLSEDRVYIILSELPMTVFKQFMRTSTSEVLFRDGGA